MRKVFAYLLLAVCVVSLYAPPTFAVVRTERNSYFIDDATGSAQIKNGNKQKARDDAKRAAYRDAIDKAMEMFAGEVNSDMRNRVFAKSQSMIKNFKVIAESEENGILTITGSCSVAERAFDGVLGPEVIASLGNPRIMIIVDPESTKNASIVFDELQQIFERAGYLIVDNEQAQTLLALDPSKSFGDPALLAGAAKTIKADIIIVAHASSGSVHASRFGINMYKPSASVNVKAVLTKTAYQISSTTISRGTKNWQGSSSAAGMIRSALRQAAEEIIYKIAYKMTSSSSTVSIQLANASFTDIEEFTDFLKRTGQVFERSYNNKIAELDLVSPKSARNVASLISDYELPSGRKIEVNGLTAQTISAKISGSSGTEIDVYVDNIMNEDSANEIERLAAMVAGRAGKIEKSYAAKTLRLTITYSSNPDDSNGIKALENSLRNNGIRIDSVTNDSIRGWKKSTIITLYIDNITKDSTARDLEKEIIAAVGNAGKVEASHNPPVLNITITYDTDPGNSRGIKALEATLKDNNIRIDSTTEDSIRGWHKPWLLW